MKTDEEADKEATPFLREQEMPKYLELVCDTSLEEENDGYEVPRSSMRSMKESSVSKVRYPSLPLINADETEELSTAKKESSSIQNLLVVGDHSYTNVVNKDVV